MDRPVLTDEQLEFIKTSAFFEELEKIAAVDPELAELIYKEAMSLAPVTQAVRRGVQAVGAGARSVGAGARNFAGTVKGGLNRANMAVTNFHAHSPIAKELMEGGEKLTEGAMGGHFNMMSTPYLAGASLHMAKHHLAPAARAVGSAVSSSIGRLGRNIGTSARNLGQSVGRILPPPGAAPAFA